MSNDAVSSFNDESAIFDVSIDQAIKEYAVGLPLRDDLRSFFSRIMSRGRLLGIFQDELLAVFTTSVIAWVIVSP